MVKFNIYGNACNISDGEISGDCEPITQQEIDLIPYILNLSPSDGDPDYRIAEYLIKMTGGGEIIEHIYDVEPDVIH